MRSNVSIKNHYFIYTEGSSDVYYHTAYPLELISTFEGCKGFCFTCGDFILKKLSAHKLKDCDLLCDKCRQHPPCKLDCNDNIKCPICLQYFYNNRCLENHKKSEICENVYICKNCRMYVNKYIDKSSDHVCNIIHCSKCYDKNIHLNRPHHCFIQPTKDETLKSRNRIFLFYDIETLVDEDKIFIPVLLCYELTCSFCITDQKEKCLCPPTRSGSFYYNGDKDESIGKRFVELLEQFDNLKNVHKVIIYAHNGHSFDNVLILADIFSRAQVSVFSKTGCKISRLKIGKKIEFADSFKLFRGSLRSLAKSLGTETCKSFFPYRFLEFDNLNKICDNWPSKDYYDIDPADIAEFNLYYQSTPKFDVKEELIIYCFKDVTVLKQIFEKYYLSILNMFDFDLSNCSIAASLAFSVFKRKFLHKNEIPLITDANFRKYSNMSIRCLEYISYKTSKKIYHARNQVYGEQFIKHLRTNSVYFLDGFTLDKNNEIFEVFEFQGCVYHPHIGCKMKNIPEVLHGVSKQDRLFATEKKMQALRELYGVNNVYQIYECEYLEYIKRNKIKLSYFMDRFEKSFKPRLNPRDGLMGGRTEKFASSFTVDLNMGGEINYIDFVSLYPYILLTKEFPVGTPRIRLGFEYESV